jgi:hypothetical protein
MGRSGVVWVGRAWMGWVSVVGCSETGLSSLDKPEPETTTIPETTIPESTPVPEEPTLGDPLSAPPPPAPPEEEPEEPEEPEPEPPVEPVADAGGDVVVMAGETAWLDGTASYDPMGGSLVYLWQVLSAPYGSAPVLLTADTPTVDLLTDVDGTYVLELGVQNAAGLWDSTPDLVIVTAEPAPPVADAGADTVYQPLETVELDGTASYDPGGYEPLTYAWTLLSKPTNSTATLDDPTKADPTFFADLAGDYLLELSVTNSLGTVDPTPDQVLVTTTPADGFYVELSWTTNADLDLHLLNSTAAGIFDCPNDCNYDRPNPNWGLSAATDDDPSLDADTIPTVSGAGPEIITIDVPYTDVYTVMVHYFGKNGSSSCGACPNADATVNIYLGGVLAATYNDTLFQDDDVWEVATIDWPSGLITPISVMSSTTRTVCY